MNSFDQIKYSIISTINSLYGSIKGVEVTIGSFGDLSCNAAMVLARQLKKAPRDIAQEIVKELESVLEGSRIEIAGPGFINIYLNPTAWEVIATELLTM